MPTIAEMRAKLHEWRRDADAKRALPLTDAEKLANLERALACICVNCGSHVEPECDCIDCGQYNPAMSGSQ